CVVCLHYMFLFCILFFFQAEDGIRDDLVTGVQTCALPISEQRLSAIDRQEVASLCASYKDAAPPLLGLLNGAEERHLFHVDLRRDSPQLGMPASVLREVLNAVEALRRITPRAWPRTALDTFRKRFTDRYGDRVVALMAALDEDSGIGFEVDPGSRRNENLLSHFNFPSEADTPSP